ncbi:MAG: hypothetical protein ABUL77_01955 [Bacteroidota bacterium]
MRHSAALRIASMLLAVGFVPVAAPPRARADEATNVARGHYETGLELFYAREHAQALIEFQRAHEVKARPATLFMMGQCEYLLGSLRQARDHYQEYLRESPTGEFVEVAKDRIEAINRRPATLVINTVPDQVDVRITAAAEESPPGLTPPGPVQGPSADAAAPARAPAPGSGSSADARSSPVVTGQAPNNFAVPRGRWTIVASKSNYVSQQATVDLEVAETKPMFFKLDPIPARLEIETVPANATLYVNGNRTQNPYRQDVPPGRFEVFGEASNYDDQREEFVLGPGAKRLLVGPKAFHLRYVQRSGRPELFVASGVLGGLVGAGAVAAALREDANNPDVSTVTFLIGGAVAGTVTGVLLANNVVPAYIPDNRALFILGGMWIGAAEGALAGIVLRQTRETPRVENDHENLGAFKKVPDLSRAAFIGSLPGLAVGITGGSLLSRRAPTYGRVSLIQSAAAGGALVGALTAATLQWNPFGWQRVVPKKDKAGNVIGFTLDSGIDPSIPALIGLNVGLAAGLLGAYLPDQSRYGPTWKRIALIDLAAGAGALAAGIGACVNDNRGCLTSSPDSSARARTAGIALLGGAVGVVAGILLTRNIDRDLPATTGSAPPPSLTLLPVPDGRGGVTPTLSAVGFF